MAGHGGKRPGAGRKPGAVSKAKRDLSEMAKDHAAQALKTLAEIAKQGQSEAARVSAAVAILDRAYGKPMPAPEPINDDEALPVTVTIGRRTAVGNVRVTGTE
ncbi:hypothetical protein [Paracoccus yeei]|uniref:hypothetical protein n=1 Tax=Paracoccus yeei TaxID=147645 RepID=UPI001748EE53|nr:hypothetical protein [Paracoccus yeei]